MEEWTIKKETRRLNGHRVMKPSRNREANQLLHRLFHNLATPRSGPMTEAECNVSVDRPGP